MRIIHYETRKLVTYKGNLTEFIKQYPAAKSTPSCPTASQVHLPVPGFWRAKSKDKAIVKANNCHFTYPNTDRQIIQGASIALAVVRVACLEPNGASKSTFTSCSRASEPDIGTVGHPNMRYAYVAQHAFHHVEQHLEKTPNEYIRAFQTGEDKENLTKVRAVHRGGGALVKRGPVPQEDGSVLKLVVERFCAAARRSQVRVRGAVEEPVQARPPGWTRRLSVREE